MKQYIEYRDGIIPVDSCVGGIFRTEGAVQDRYEYFIELHLDLEENNVIKVAFISTRGRDTGFYEITSNLGRGCLMNLAKFQEWVDR